MPDSPSASPAGPAADAPQAVLKFGGTSVGSPDRFRRVVAVAERTARLGRIVVVVSALSKVTRQLSGELEAFATHGHDQAIADELVDALRSRHLEQAAEVLGPDTREEYATIVEERLDHLQHVFQRVRREHFSAALRDAVLATGEQLAVPMVTLALRDAGFSAPHCDATKLVVTDDTFGEANVVRDATIARIRQWYADLPTDVLPVVAGFIGATADGRTTTLGFEGSDYTAALFTAILGARCLTRYTDIDALYTEDPRTSERAQRLERISMETAYAMTESGRLGMHPKTLRPLVEAGIPMQVRCIDHPGAPGTLIMPDGLDGFERIPPVSSGARTDTPQQ